MYSKLSKNLPNTEGFANNTKSTSLRTGNYLARMEGDKESHRGPKSKRFNATHHYLPVRKLVNPGELNQQIGIKNFLV